MEWLGGGSTRRQFEAFVDGAVDSLYRTGYLLTQDASEAEIVAAGGGRPPQPASSPSPSPSPW